MHLLFAFDDYTDNAPHEVVHRYADIVMDAARNPIKSRSSDEVVLGVSTQEYSFSNCASGLLYYFAQFERHASQRKNLRTEIILSRLFRFLLNYF